MKKLLCLGASVLAMSIFCATAEEGDKPAAEGAAPAVEKAKKADAAPKVEAKEMTLTGMVSKEEKTGKKGPMTVYTLTTDDGMIAKLPGPRHAKTSKDGKEVKGAKDAKEAAAPEIKLDEFVGAKVKVVGMAYEKTDAEGKKMVAFSKITTIEKVAAEAPAAAPAPAPAPAAE